MGLSVHFYWGVKKTSECFEVNIAGKIPNFQEEQEKELQCFYIIIIDTNF